MDPPSSSSQPTGNSDKIFDEFPTMIAQATVPDTTGDATKYELDDFSIYKVGDDKPQQKQEPEKLDFNNPDDFLIGSQSLTSTNYVDLDFVSQSPQQSSTAPAVPSEKDNFAKEAQLFDKNLTEVFNVDNLNDIQDEKFDFPDEMSTSIISQNDNSNSSFSELHDLPSFTVPVSESTKLDTNASGDESQLCEVTTPTIQSLSELSQSSLLNMDLVSQAELSKTVLNASGESGSSDNSANTTKVEILAESSTVADSSAVNTMEKDDSLTRFLQDEDDVDDLPSNFEVDIHAVSDVDTEPLHQPLVLDSEEHIPNFGASIPSTIPEEEVQYTYSVNDTEVAHVKYGEASIETLSDSNNESDHVVDSRDSKSSIKPTAEDEHLSFDLSGRKEQQLPISEAKTIDVQPEFAEEFIVSRSPPQQFFDESLLRRQSLEKEQVPRSPPASQVIKETSSPFFAEESAPTMQTTAPVLTTFALTSQPAPSLDEFVNLRTTTSIPVDSPAAVGTSNTLPFADISSSTTAQVYESGRGIEQQQPAAVDLSDYDDEPVVAATSASTTFAPASPTKSSSPSPPPSPPPSQPVTTTALDSPLPPPQQVQQSEHEDIIVPSSTNLLHTSSPNDQVLSALQEQTEEAKDEPPQKKTTSWSRDNKAAEVEEEAALLANKKLEGNTPEQAAASTTIPNTRPPFSQSAPSAPDTIASSTTMGRKNNQFRRENSNDEAEYSGPDSIKEYIQTVLGANVAELVYWRDPKNTGIVFGTGLVILLSLSVFSVISVVAYTLLFTLLGTLSFRVYKNVLQAVQKTSEGHPFKEYLEVEINPSKERINEIVEQLVNSGTCFVKRMRSVLLVEDIVDSLKYLLIFWALTYIGAWFNGLTLVILSYLAAFSAPKVYELNKTQIDQYLDLINSKITEISEKVPYLKKVTGAAEKKEE